MLHVCCLIMLFIVEKRAQRYTFQPSLPNILASIFFSASKKKAKGALYTCIIRHIPVKRTEGAKVNNK